MTDTEAALDIAALILYGTLSIPAVLVILATLPLTWPLIPVGILILACLSRDPTPETEA